MKIAIVASPVTPLRPAQVGGAQAFVCDLAVGLGGRGHDVTLFCAEGSEVPGVSLSTVPVPADAAAALVMPGGRVPEPASGVRAALAAMFDSIHSGAFDVVSQHAFDAPAFELGHGLPILHTLHLPPLVPAVVAAALRVEPSRLATVSRSCQAGWRAAGVDVAHVLPNGVGETNVIQSPVEMAALVAGRLSPEKGIEHAIAAAKEANISVKVAGAHYDPGYEVDLGGAEFLGSLPRIVLRELMAQVAVTICAVRWDEPFGMVAAEAQMSGCPVAAYRRGAMPEVIEDGVSGVLVEPDDIHGLGRAIRGCLALEREGVLASARRRLSLGAALDRYESALLQATP